MLSIASDLFYQTCHVDISNISHIKRNPLRAERLLRSYSRNICTLAETKTIIADTFSSSEMAKPTFYEYFHDLEADAVLHLKDGSDLVTVQTLS